MPPLLPSAMRIYKVSALLGTLIILADLGFSWMRIQTFENTVTEVFESMVTTQMEIDGLRQELQHIDKAIAQSAELKAGSSAVQVDGVEYTEYEIEKLNNEQASIQLFIQEKQLDLVGISSEKKSIMNEVRILFLISLLFLVMGTLLAAFGYLAWYFKVELFEDRRKAPR